MDLFRRMVSSSPRLQQAGGDGDNSSSSLDNVGNASQAPPITTAVASPSRFWSSKPSSSRSSTATATASACVCKLLQSEQDVLEQLGLNDKLCILRDSILARFCDLQDAKQLCTLDLFMKDCITRGHSPVWGDAAFRAFEHSPGSGALNAYGYCCAIVSLLADEEELQRNAKWLELRRRTLFKFYDSFNEELLDQGQFNSFLSDVSSSTSRLQHHGIDLTLARLAEREDKSLVSNEAIIQGLAICKVHLAERTAELQDLQMAYLKLEKKYCALKLELAEERAAQNDAIVSPN